MLSELVPELVGAFEGLFLQQLMGKLIVQLSHRTIPAWFWI